MPRTGEVVITARRRDNILEMGGWSGWIAEEMLGWDLSMEDCEGRLYIRGEEGRMGGSRWKKLLTESWRG